MTISMSASENDGPVGSDAVPGARSETSPETSNVFIPCMVIIVTDGEDTTISLSLQRITTSNAPSTGVWEIPIARICFCI